MKLIIILIFLSYGCSDLNSSTFREIQNKTSEEFLQQPVINWKAVIWVKRPLPLWAIQVAVAIISLSEALLRAYLNYKVCFYPIFVQSL